jgi:hypothetical protein
MVHIGNINRLNKISTSKYAKQDFEVVLLQSIPQHVSATGVFYKYVLTIEFLL